MSDSEGKRHLKAVILGGTGFFGHNLAQVLYESNEFDSIVLYARHEIKTEADLSNVDYVDEDVTIQGFHNPSYREVRFVDDNPKREPATADEFVVRSNRSSIMFPPMIRCVQGDITDWVHLKKVLRGCDVVFNACGNTSFWNAQNRVQWRTNVDGPATVMQVMRELVKETGHPMRLIHTSTVDVMGHNFHGSTPLKEVWPWHNYSYDGMGYHYADSKREGETVVKAGRNQGDMPDGFSCVVIRPGSMIGPWDVTNQYGRLFRDLKLGNVPGIPSGGTSMCHVRDVAEAHLAAALADREKVHKKVFICAGANITYRELFNEIYSKIQRPVSAKPQWTIPMILLVIYGWFCENVLTLFYPGPPEINPGMARYMSVNAWYSSKRAADVLNYNIAPDRWKVGVQESYDWYRRRGRL